MVQVIDGTAEQEAVVEGDLLHEFALCSSVTESSKFCKPNIGTLRQLVEDQLRYVSHLIVDNENCHSRNKKLYSNELSDDSRFEEASPHPVDHHRPPKQLSRKIGTLYESQTLQDHDLYHETSKSTQNFHDEDGLNSEGLRDGRESRSQQIKISHYEALAETDLGEIFHRPD
jgi:hypothetical protein